MNEASDLSVHSDLYSGPVKSILCTTGGSVEYTIDMGEAEYRSQRLSQ
jgi:hypothetical protein